MIAHEIIKLKKRELKWMKRVKEATGVAAYKRVL